MQPFRFPREHFGCNRAAPTGDPFDKGFGSVPEARNCGVGNTATANAFQLCWRASSKLVK
jgi:hypothetical protein